MYREKRTCATSQLNSASGYSYSPKDGSCLPAHHRHHCPPSLNNGHQWPWQKSNMCWEKSAVMTNKQGKTRSAYQMRRRHKSWHLNWIWSLPKNSLCFGFLLKEGKDFQSLFNFPTLFVPSLHTNISCSYYSFLTYPYVCIVACCSYWRKAWRVAPVYNSFMSHLGWMQPILVAVFWLLFTEYCCFQRHFW